MSAVSVRTSATVADRRTARVPGAARRLGVTGVLVLATLGLLLFALSHGDYPLTVGELLRSLVGGGDEMAREIVLTWRLPRAAAAIVFGAALACSGAIFQSIARNPLGSPDVLGFSTGSYTGVLVVLVLLGAGVASTTVGAVVGGLVAAVAVYLFAARGGVVNGFRLVVVGVAVTAVLHAVNTWLLLRAGTEVAMTASIWGAGSISLVDWSTGGPAIVLLVALAPVVWALVRPLRQLELGDDAAASHGVRVEGSRRALLAVGVVLTSVVTAVGGPIPFIALSAPQIARRLTGSAGLPFVASAATGAFLLLGSDILAQFVLPGDVPVGSVTVILGGSYLLWLLVHEAKRHA